VGCADVLARLVEKSLVARGERAGEGATACSRRSPVRARPAPTEAAETAAIAARQASWALALAEEERDSPLLEREAANLRVALDTLLAREPHDALRLCVALWPFWLRRIDLAEAQRRFAEALAAAPERTALRAEALFATAALDFRAGTLSRGMARAEGSYRVAAEVGDASAEWRAMQFLGEFGVAERDRDRRRGDLARARARARAARGIRGPRGDRRVHARRRALGARRPRWRGGVA
jgi:hypothetical protein